MMSRALTSTVVLSFVATLSAAGGAIFMLYSLAPAQAQQTQTFGYVVSEGFRWRGTGGFAVSSPSTRPTTRSWPCTTRRPKGG